ncbi:DUF3014 domain-containing protein [Shewanella sp.]|uniref:DUF3014 domain-containing protein n=1 Tax=Shewanella sp. TaxID=50422 RepID=UPI003A97918D
MQVNEEDRIAPQEKRSGTANAIWALVVVILIGAGAGYYFWSTEETDEEPAARTEVALPAPAPEQPLVTEADVPEPEATPEPTAQAPEQPAVEQPKVEPLPELNNSDTFVHDKVVAMANGMAIDSLLNNSDMVRQFVVFVDNIAQGQLARKTSPLKEPAQSFTVTDITNKTYLNPDSYHRYDMYADFLSGLNDEQLVATYQRMKPLLEQAFAELGYPDTNFNTRLQQAFKEILAAPVIDQPIELYSISVNYRFVDPKLETLPNAQKLMVRMGPDNTRKVKRVIRRLSEQLSK